MFTQVCETNLVSHVSEQIRATYLRGDLGVSVMTESTTEMLLVRFLGN